MQPESRDGSSVTIDTPSVSPSRSARRVLARLFAISFLGLFFELACIRWFGSTVVFLTFFTNLILMACFLGLSVGCLAASRRQNFINFVVPLMLVATVLADGALSVYNRFSHVTIDVGHQARAQEVFFGTEERPADPTRFVVPIEAVAGVFFVLVALTFVGIGQEMGRAFDAVPDRVRAYTVNVLGSLVGIVAFFAVSYGRIPPPVWFAVVAALVLPFVTRYRWLQGGLVLVALVAVALGSYRVEFAALRYGVKTDGQPRAGVPQTIWSPYYKIEYDPSFRGISVNNIRHQAMVDADGPYPAYALPHLLNRDSGGKPFEDVLVIGAGSGNDVQAALSYGAKRVDAVEIDRVIYELGKAHHPKQPYDDPRVVPHFDDGRSFVHGTDRHFDLITYSLVDSLVLHSGYTNLRLESFLFTEQALRDVKAKLKPGGVFAMYNLFRQGWVTGRLTSLIEEVFGSRPIVITIPHQDEIKPSDSQREAITFLLVGNNDSRVIDQMRQAFAAKGNFWSYRPASLNRPVNGFSPEPTVAGSDDPVRISPAAVDTSGFVGKPTDDWPFLYLREPIVPALNIRGILIVAVLSLVIFGAFAPVRTARPNGQMFFLGAGFMLLETKGVVHMAILFGSTWVVNSIVFFAILVMILLSNLYVLMVRPRRQWLFYVLLAAGLAVNVLVPMSAFLALPGAARTIVSCAVVFVPVFFAGVIFAMAFRDSTHPDVDFGANIVGVILGGLSENLSLVVGFNYLLVLAIVYYLLSAVLRPRLVGTVSSST